MSKATAHLTESELTAAIQVAVGQQKSSNWFLRLKEAFGCQPDLFLLQGAVREFLYSALDELAPTVDDKESARSYFRRMDNALRTPRRALLDGGNTCDNKENEKQVKAVKFAIRMQEGKTWFRRMQQAFENRPELFKLNGTVRLCLYECSGQIAPSADDEENLLQYFRLMDAEYAEGIVKPQPLTLDDLLNPPQAKK